MKTGLIYKISVNEDSNYLYGSTTLKLSARKAGYLFRLRRGIYENTYLQNCFNKYGENNIKWEIVQDKIPESILEIVEDIWIGANCSKSIDQKGGLNFKDAFRPLHSEETKIRMSKIKKEKGMTDKCKDAIRQSFKERYEKGEINLWTPEAIKKRVESRLKNKKRHSEEVRKKMSNSQKGTTRKSLRKEVYQFTKEGILIRKFSSLLEADKITGVPNNKISACCNKKAFTAGKFKWSFNNYLNL